jgi:hypothetical protein
MASGMSLGSLVYQDGEVTSSRFLMWNTYNYLGRETGYPAISVNKVEEGECMYIAFPIGRGIVEMKDVNYNRLVFDMVHRLLGHGLIEGNAPPGVQFILNRQDKRLVLHMLNHHIGALGNYGDDEKITLLSSFKVRLNLSRIGDVRTVELAPKAEGFGWRIEGSWLELDIPRLAIHSAVVIEG